jgi:hypothetical protein
VSNTLRQGLIIASGGLVLAGTVVWLARHRLISLRYALGWITIALIALLTALIAPLITPLAQAVGMSPTGVFVALGTGLLIAITLQLSISVSGLQSQLRDLAEAHALLSRRLEEAESTGIEPQDH